MPDSKKKICNTCNNENSHLKIICENCEFAICVYCSFPKTDPDSPTLTGSDTSTDLSKEPCPLCNSLNLRHHH